MSELPRRTIEELKTRYFCEPELYDIYVEGNFDNTIITSWCNKHKESKIVSYEINTVEIPCEILNKYNLTEGKKQRVVALAKELAHDDFSGYRCLVDKDLEHWIDELEYVPNLIKTDYCSLELYYFKEDVIKRIIVEVSGSKILIWDEFFTSFVDVLKRLYCLRLSGELLKLNLEWIELDKYISFKGSSLIFNNALYAERVLLKNAKRSRLDEFNLIFDRWLGQLNGDPRFYIRGHDFVKMISLSNKGFKGLKNFQDELAIERLFIAFIDEVQELIDSIIKSL
ncbi:MULTISPECIES: DUF4435 domain-containing protein [unclassified Pantoea]|uniref:DUF4435 domain-containing protein n=1 Tax=unclassified Pantoea TaxID=2630326 RepID=UPI0024775EDD|nr:MULTISPECIES: DUF4435 domain-containing protein [unclassified Pantoea]GME29671.1 hypothetical protein ACJ3_02420 [Pantoea sp. QMID3]GME29925.1 hypothetical protein ACJ1_02410 [Pantoea sp. QMID1]GME49523.1 hypothetical protein ACJ4_02420 [Pantoea sp. QMID4]GME50665.1 hypothetical protein ACJ2_02410 [Pantoea sp. QMID2]